MRVQELGALLDLTRANKVPRAHHERTAHETVLDWLDDGLLRVTPATVDESAPALVLSAGIHGNETAPMELLDRLLRAIAEDKLIPAGPILIVLGNPEAIRHGTRYVEVDLNRQFNATHQGPLAEHRRAKVIEQTVEAFYSDHEQHRRRYHIDMHTAIRASHLIKFALVPGTPEHPRDSQMLELLACTDIEAVVEQSRLGITFSNFTYGQLNAHAVTLELGKARPFGQNQNVDVSALERTLTTLIETGWLDTDMPRRPLRCFGVSFEILKQSEAFVLHVNDDQPNFVEYAKGACLAEDGDTRWVTGSERNWLIFPNPNVALGLRAGIVLHERPAFTSGDTFGHSQTT
ncbi:succinylglutamate desuccinylase [Larsenimonas salina]|uniref:succinylglutamate desuccinylase n=1 Tax=Larsenimonas salina TaxID=1295565 RepID=UPI00207484A5|nr:succinylglutamate desuccinylase [Larsenimonas salina]MCM5703304.1 succinylglutamate desuccinylase [Larsenimonas salina]